MQVYELVDADRFQTIGLKDRADRERFYCVFGQGRRSNGNWTPPEMELLGSKEGLAVGDFPGSPYAPIFSERAVAALGDLLNDAGELLPVICGPSRYYAFNVLAIVDAVDEEKSEVFRVSSGKVVRIEKYAFHPHRVANLTLFNVPQLTSANYLFATDRCRSRAMEAKLLGMEFRTVWRESNVA